MMSFSRVGSLDHGFRQYSLGSSTLPEGSMHWPLWRVAVAERSMEPAFRPGDWLLVWRGLRPSRPPHVRPGQVVVSLHPERPDLLLIKRATRREPRGWYLSSDNPG